MSDRATLVEAFDPDPSDETRKVWISQRQWVEFKTELTYGERKRLDVASFRTAQFEGEKGNVSSKYEMDMSYQRSLTLALYVVEWNVEDARGKRLKIPEGLTGQTGRIAFFSERGDKFCEAVAEALDSMIEELAGEQAAADADEDTGDLPPGNGPSAMDNGASSDRLQPSPVLELTPTSYSHGTGAGDTEN